MGDQAKDDQSDRSVLMDERANRNAEEYNLLDLAIALAKHKKMILRVSGAAAVGSLIVALALPKIYAATAVLMPPQQEQPGATALLSMFAAPGGLRGSGVASALGLKSPNDLYVGILQSRSIADKIISRFKLQEVYADDTLVDTRKDLAENTTVTAEKSGLINIQFEDKSAERAAKIANAYVEELEALTRQLAILEASRRRAYFAQAAKNAKEELNKAELTFKDVQERTGLIKLDDQARSILEAVAGLRGAIAAKQIEIEGIKTFATESNPDYLLAKQELAGMTEQLAKLERNNKVDNENLLIQTGRLPTAGLEYANKYRDVKYYETIYELVAKQYELAKIDEGKNPTLIQVVDAATVPDKKSKPQRALIVLISTVIGFAVASCAALLIESWRKAASSDEVSAKVAELRRNLRRST